MSIIRVEKSRNFSVISNEPMRDERLSFAARGLLAYLLTKPDNWNVRMEDLFASSPQGRTAVQSMMKELEEFGYVERRTFKGEDGRFTWETIIHETVSRQTADGKPVDGKPVDIRSTEKPISSNGGDLGAKEAVTQVFSYYCAKLNRDPKTYTLTPERMARGIARFKEARQISEIGDEGAKNILEICVDQLACSAFHLGDNVQKKKYIDWVDHLFKSREKMEKWLSEAETRVGA